jgi:predicted ATPase
LDDLQWTDEMSIKLLEPLLTDNQADHFLILSTHRKLERSGPASKLRDKLVRAASSRMLSQKKAANIVISLQLSDWTCEEVCELISHVLRRSREEVWKLATVVHKKTGGTIFFVIQYLRLLYQKKLLTYSLRNYRWEYSMSRIAYETDLCDNVSEFMGDKIGQLPRRIQIPIVTAAFLGFSRFDSKILWRIIQVSPVHPLVVRKEIQEVIVAQPEKSSSSSSSEENSQVAGEASITKETTARDAKSDSNAAENGKDIVTDYYSHHNKNAKDKKQEIDCEINSLEDLEKILEFAVEEGLINKMPYHKRWFKFSHDRVREGALALAPTGFEEQKLHLQIGRELRDIRIEMEFEERKSLMHQGMIGGGTGLHSKLSGQEVRRLLLLAVRHLNEGSSSIMEPNEKVQLARMNLEAAEAVLQQSAFGPALEFLQSGLLLLDRRRKWDDHYELTLKITVKLSHVLFCNGEHEENWVVIDDVLRNSKNLADKLSVCRTLIVALVAAGRFAEAVETNLDVLDQLGVQIPRKIKAIHLVTSYMRTRQKLRRKTDEDLIKFESGADRWALHQCDFLILLMETCMLGGQVEIQILATMQALWLVLDRGIEEMASMAMAGAGYIYGLRGRNDKSYRFGKLAARIASQGKNPSLDSRAMSYAYQYLIPWREPYHKCLDPLMSAYKMALDRGDIEQLFLPIMSKSHAPVLFQSLSLGGG